MIVARGVAELRAARATLGTLGLVPTMGFLHAGHLGLIARARTECGQAAASIFVNPTQFAPGEDLDRYPRDLERDLAVLDQAGAALVFVPETETIYPPGFSTRIEVGPIAAPLEGAVRPGHFAGVATVVAKLINLVQPDAIYFGQKDAQQCAVVRQMIRDLDMSVRMVVGETVREPDGLALSSRNAYLDPAQRAQAPLLHQALQAGRAAYDRGERDAARLREAMQTVLRRTAIDYVSAADPETLSELTMVGKGGVLLSLAVRFGATRLIDNVLIAPGPAKAVAPKTQ